MVESWRAAVSRHAAGQGPSGHGGAGAVWRGMVVLVAIGIILALAGLAGILWCIRAASRLRRADLSDDDARAELGRIMFAHAAGIGTAFLGLALLVIGLLLQ